MTSEAEAEKAREALMALIRERKETIRKTRYKTEAYAETFTDPARSQARVYSVMLTLHEENWDLIEAIFGVLIRYQRFFDNIYAWINHFNTIISSAKPYMKEEEKEKIELLERRIGELEREAKEFKDHKPLLEYIREAVERARKSEKQVGSLSV